MNPVRQSPLGQQPETASAALGRSSSNGMNVVIMAGGGGTRLWPLSLQDNPKQFVDLGTGKPLLVHAYERAVQMVDQSHIFIATSKDHSSRVQEMLSDVPQERMFLEPTRRDTTAAFINVCLRLVKAGRGDEPTTFLWSDHIFTNERKFLEDLKSIAAIIEEHPNALVVVGHVPLNPNTALGYLKAGQPIPGRSGTYKVEKFVEKPDRDKAEEYVANGNYFWNLGYFSLKPAILVEKITKLTPELAQPIEKLRTTIQQGNETEWAKAYQSFPKEALEKTFVEKTDEIYAVTGDYGWSDVGNWSTVKEIFGTHGDYGARGHHIHVDSENNFIYNTTNKAVSVIGMEGAVIVVTDKAVLVCDESSTHQVRDVVQKIEKEGRDEYL